MRILGITNLFSSPWFPLRGIFNRQQFAALAERNPIRMIVPVSWTDELRIKRGDTPKLAGRQAKLDGIVVEYPRYVYPPKVLRGSYGHCFQTSIRRAFFNAIEQFQPDVILSAWAYPDGWAAVRLAHQVGLPVVVKIHGSDVLVLSKIAACRARISEMLRDADGVLAVSRDLARHAVAFGASPQRIRTIYDGVDISRFHPGNRREALARLGLPEGAPLILFIGNLLAVKGVDVLIQACLDIKSRGLKFRCYLIGQGPLRESLEDLIARLGLADCVTLVGPMPHAHLPDWYRAADVFVLPSHSEGVPCVLLEAAACQTPFVATEVGGIPEAAEWGESKLVPPGDSAALASAVIETLETASAGRVGPTFVRTHAEAAAEIDEFLETVVGKFSGSTPAVRGFRPPVQPMVGQ